VAKKCRKEHFLGHIYQYEKWISQGCGMYHNTPFHLAREQKSMYAFLSYCQSVNHHVEMIDATTT